MKRIPLQEVNIILPLVDAFGNDIKTVLELGNKKSSHGVYKKDFKELGITHTSVDWNGKDGALNLDLRKPLNLGKFDMVTNFGTTEHVDEQYPVWKNIHDSLKVGGILVGETPYPGNLPGHGIWYPTLEFYMEFQTELCEIAYKYGADKCPQINHQYTPFYYEFLKDKRYEFKKIFEYGVGNRRIFHAIPHYQMGASLRMWRDFFPNAQVYGADIAHLSVFKDERLETFYCNERDENAVRELINKVGTDIDLFVDDASHHTNDQMFLFKTVMPMLKKDVIYVIEDSRHTRALKAAFPEYDCYIPDLLKNEKPNIHDRLVIFTNKK